MLISKNCNTKVSFANFNSVQLLTNKPSAIVVKTEFPLNCTVFKNLTYNEPLSCIPFAVLCI